MDWLIGEQVQNFLVISRLFHFYRQLYRCNGFEIVKYLEDFKWRQFSTLRDTGRLD